MTRFGLISVLLLELLIKLAVVVVVVVVVVVLLDVEGEGKVRFMNKWLLAFEFELSALVKSNTKLSILLSALV